MEFKKNGRKTKKTATTILQVGGTDQEYEEGSVDNTGSQLHGFMKIDRSDTQFFCN